MIKIRLLTNADIAKSHTSESKHELIYDYAAEVMLFGILYVTVSEKRENSAQFLVNGTRG